MKGVREYMAHPYGVRVWFAASPDALAALAQRFKCDAPAEVVGCVLRPSPGTIIVAVLDGNRATLVHECAHAALFVLEHVGINPTDSGGEAFCYLLDHMYTALERHLQPLG